MQWFQSAVTEGTVHVSLNKLIEQMICTEQQTTERRQPVRKLLQMFLLKEHIPNHWNNLKIPDETAEN